MKKARLPFWKKDPRVGVLKKLFIFMKI